MAANRKWPRWLRFTLRGLAMLVVLQIIFCLGFIWYVNSHKKEVLAMVTGKLNENLNGKLAIGSMEPTFLEAFPRISLHLKNVTIRDHLFQKHHQTLLQAGDFDMALDAIAFLRGTVEIYKISISDASVNLYTDASGYSNSAVFKSNSKKADGSTSYPELRKFELDHVNLTIDNRSKNKLFQFEIDHINGNMNTGSDGWKARFSLKALVKSLAFSTEKGSFIKGKKVEGNFDIRFEKPKDRIVISQNKLEIGEENFKISAEFVKTKSNTTDYAIHIVNDEILWRNAEHLLTSNIYSKLDLFNFSDPIAVKCDISGNFDIEGDPLILVRAKIKDNELTTPGGLVTDCNFTGIFTNNNISEKGFNDANSAIKFENFKGVYAGMPFSMRHAAILNLEKPIAKGDFKSTFELRQLAHIIDARLVRFSKGTADVNLSFNADIVNYSIAKPIVTGTVAVKDGDIQYMPRQLKFTKTSVLLNFMNDDLLIRNLHLQSGKSIIDMQGEIRNFLNLYYSAPEKVVLTWKVNCPEIHLAEFIKFLGKRSVSKKPAQPKKNADFTEDINTFFEKSRVSIALRVKKLYYNKFLATNVRADIWLADSGIMVKNGGLSNSNGLIDFSAKLTQQDKINHYLINARVKDVNVSQFFAAFDDFGLESMHSKNLNGVLSAQSNLSGKITDNGQLVPNTMSGTVAFNLNNGALINFDPIRKIGKYAFPLRDMNTIVFRDLNGKFAIAGEKVTISPMQVNSSVLNMDVEGLYSFGKGTSINVSVPLRNPEKDKGITDADALAKRRERGVVVRLLAADDETGKVKIKLVSKKTQLEEKSSRNN